MLSREGTDPDEGESNPMSRHMMNLRRLDAMSAASRGGVRAVAAISAILTLALVLGACAPAERPCPVPLPPDGEPQSVELPADAIPPDEAAAVTSPAGGGSQSASGGTEGDPDEAANGGDNTEASAATATAAQVTSRVDLVYFHTANPCGCMAEIGDVIDSALQTHFADEMDRKTVRFFTVVSDDPANENLVRMYGSQQFDLFLVTYEGGKARSTQVYEIWALLGDNEAIALAVKSRVADAVAEG